MKSPKYPSRYSLVGGLALALALATAAPSAYANVYATNIKLNGGLTNTTVAQGSSVSISYILNEPAPSGVTIKILSGATAVRTITLAGGTQGTTRGTNTVTWDGKNDGGGNVPGGNYSVSIKAASTGYAGWTLTTDDNNEGNLIWFPTGIAIDRNTNSPYYGRVLAANSEPQAGSPLGYQVGILKCNADGSYADEGGLSTGGYGWAGDGNSPWKIRMSADDYVYVNDFAVSGDIYRFDPTISAASQLHVLSSTNRGPGYDLSGPGIFGTGTNTEIWMADGSYNGGVTSVGILRYFVSADGACSNGDTGTVMVATGGDLSLYPFDVALDKAHNIYTVQYCFNPGDPAARVLRFAADPSTNSNRTFPESTADWTAGSGGDVDWCQANGLAVDPTGAYLAVGFLGAGGGVGGNTKILSTADGSVITNLDLGVRLSGYTEKGDYDVDWDAVGNVYLVDEYSGVWRAYSPPGTNQATTLALPVVQVIAPMQPPYITSIGASAGTNTIHFTGATSDPASTFLLLSATVVQGPYSPEAGAIITGSGGAFQVVVLVNGPVRFYRIERLAAIPIRITNLSIAGTTVTLNFTGSPSDSPLAFTLLSSAAANGTYATAAGASVIQVSPGLFQATVLVNGPRQYYQIRK
jgi:hypothetical protein